MNMQRTSPQKYTLNSDGKTKNKRKQKEKKKKNYEWREIVQWCSAKALHLGVKNNIEAFGK